MRAMSRASWIALLAVGILVQAAHGSPSDGEFTLDLTAEWQAALLDGRLTAVDSWTDYALGDLFTDPPTTLVQPTLDVGVDELVANFEAAVPEDQDEVYGLSYNYPADPDLSKKKIVLDEAEVDKGKEMWVLLEDTAGLRKKAKLVADDSGKKMKATFPVWAKKKGDLVVINGLCELLLKDIGFDATKIKTGKGGIYTAAKKAKKSVPNSKKLGKLTVVPEPATLALVALGGAAVAMRRRRA